MTPLHGYKIKSLELIPYMDLISNDLISNPFSFELHTRDEIMHFSEHNSKHDIDLEKGENCWMDGLVRVLRPFNSISVISRRWEDEHERLCAMKRRLGSGRISPPTGFEPATP